MGNSIAAPPPSGLQNQGQQGDANVVHNTGGGKSTTTTTKKGAANMMVSIAAHPALRYHGGEDCGPSPPHYHATGFSYNSSTNYYPHHLLATNNTNNSRSHHNTRKRKPDYQWNPHQFGRDDNGNNNGVVVSKPIIKNAPQQQQTIPKQKKPKVTTTTTQNSTTTTTKPRSRREWDENFALLQAYYAQHGHSRVPRNYMPDPTLGRWVDRQRSFYREKRMPLDRQAKLDTLDFEWCPGVPRLTLSGGDSPTPPPGAPVASPSKAWEDMFAKLRDYKEQHGDCLVPQRFARDPSLGNWVRSQRSAHTIGSIQPDRKAKLDGIGFAWVASNHTSTTATTAGPAKKKKPAPKAIQKQQEQLCKEDTDPNTTPVTKKKKPSNGTSTGKHQVRLLKNGMTQEEYWVEMLKRLVAFQQCHGHVMVPQRYEIDPALGKWVKNLRQRADKLEPEKRAELDELGFVWVAKQGRKQTG